MSVYRFGIYAIFDPYDAFLHFPLAISISSSFKVHLSYDYCCTDYLYADPQLFIKLCDGGIQFLQGAD